MANMIIMPKQGLLMEEGTITDWLVKEGGTCTEGQPLFEMETDKLTITMDATATGTVLKILHPEGDTVPVTEPIAIVGEPGEDISALLAESESSADPAVPAHTATPKPQSEVMTATDVPAPLAPGAKLLASPRAKLYAEEHNMNIPPITGSGQDGMITEQDLKDYLAAQPAATPLSRRLADSRGIDLHDVSGTGSHGKITSADLSGTSDAKPETAASATAGAAPAASPRGTRRTAMSGMRKAICRNMLASKEQNAQTSHRITVDMTAAVALRNQYKALGIKVSYNDIIVRACAKALQDFPVVNASVDGNDIVYHDYVNIGTAVSVPNGLIVPVIKDADIIGLTGIAEQSAGLIAKARDGQLTSEDYHGGTFTVSSLGMFDLDDFVAIINPPESGILAVGKIAKTPVVETDEDGGDQIVIKSMCGLCLSYDHRIIDGAEAAKFLQKLKTYLTNPILLI